jgi:hypothetical protein
VDVGTVHDLIVDTGTMHTRYLDLRLDHDHVPNAAGRPTDDWDVLVPIGAVQLQSDDEVVKLPSISPAQLVAFPVFNHGEITSEYENAVLGGAGAAAAAATTAATPPVAHPAAQTTTPTAAPVNAVNAAPVNAAPANAVPANTIPASSLPPGVPADLLRRDDVTIERRAVDPREVTSADATKPITRDNEIRIPLVSEETVTRPVIREEIVVRRHGAPGTTGDAHNA